jgi:hypothetical protein
MSKLQNAVLPSIATCPTSGAEGDSGKISKCNDCSERGPPSPPLPPAVAVRQFVGFLQAEGFVGDQYWSGRKGLWQLYLWHCDLENTQPLSGNVLAHALSKPALKRLARDWSTGELRRPTVYHIPTSDHLERYWLKHGDAWNAEGLPH